MSKKSLILTITGILLFANLALAQGLRFSGSTTVQVIMPDLAEAFERKTNIKFASIAGGGTGKGIEQILAGEVDIAGASRDPQEAELKKGLVFSIISIDAIAVIVHKTNKIKNLTKQQLKDIHIGKINNWKEVGGEDKKIMVITSHPGSATRIEFKEKVMDKEDYRSDIIEVAATKDEVVKVAAAPGAIGAVSLAFADAKKIKIIDTDGVTPSSENVKAKKYLISRPICLVTKGKPTGDTAKFINFVLSKDGQKIAKKTFVSVK